MALELNFCIWNGLLFHQILYIITFSRFGEKGEEGLKSNSRWSNRRWQPIPSKSWSSELWKSVIISQQSHLRQSEKHFCTDSVTVKSIRASFGLNLVRLKKGSLFHEYRPHILFFHNFLKKYCGKTVFWIVCRSFHMYHNGTYHLHYIPIWNLKVDFSTVLMPQIYVSRWRPPRNELTRISPFLKIPTNFRDKIECNF